MKILSIETSCDETAIAVLSVTGSKKFKIEAHTVASQIELHKQYGGVFPMMAKREHAKNITPVLMQTLAEAILLKKKKTEISAKTLSKLQAILEREPELFGQFSDFLSSYTKPKIDRIAVTVGPGLAPALWVGINFARALSLAWDIPLVPVNHMEGHILSIFPKEKNNVFSIGKLPLPMLSLLVSGGHTEIVLVKGIGKYTMIGQTKDDAAGEAFDKVARMLGLPYPGGPQISKLAAQFRKSKNEKTIKLPRPMIHSGDFDFSFSGLKTAVLYLVRDMGGIEKMNDQKKAEIACEFEDAAVDVLVSKTLAAAKKYSAKNIIVGGGVAANKELRARLTKEAKKLGIEIVFPTKELSTDNAVMIGIAGYFAKEVPISSKKLTAQGNMTL